MQSKVFFLSAILALASASLAYEHEHKSRSSDAEFRFVPVDVSGYSHLNPLTRDTKRQIHGPYPIQKLLGIPGLAAELVEMATASEDVCMTVVGSGCENVLDDYTACQGDYACTKVLFNKCTISSGKCLHMLKALVYRQEGGGSPFDNGLHAQSTNTPEVVYSIATAGARKVGFYPGEEPHIAARAPNHSEPTYSIDPAPPVKLELKDDDEHHIVARKPGKISEEIQAAMPADVKNAILNDPGAAESLAKEFSGKSVPRWYAKLPASVTNYYATITTPPTMTGYAIKSPEKESVDQWISNVQSYKSKIKSDISVLSSVAASESREAKRLSKEAASKSKFASEHNDLNLGTIAWNDSKVAATLSHHAAAQSSFAASASRAIFNDHKDKKHTSTASASDMSLALASSIAGAVVCLGFALAL